jgi:hypothetical protein
MFEVLYQILSPAEAGSVEIMAHNPRLTPWARILSRFALNAASG